MDGVRIQGVLVEVDGIGVLIRGPSGVGKSLTALNLMDRGHRLIADDLVDVIPGNEGEPVGKAVEEDVRIEVRGLGIFGAGSLFRDGVLPASRIGLVVDLEPFDPARDAGRTHPETATVKILGNELPAVRAPVPSGADPAFYIELLVRGLKADGSVTVE